MKYTKEMSFREFLDAIWPGIRIAVIGILAIGLVGGGLASVIHDGEINEQHFYQALQGKKVNDTKISQTASIVKEIYQGKFREWTEPQWLSIYHDLQGDNVNYEKALNTKVIFTQIIEGKFQDWENLDDYISSSSGNQNIVSVFSALKNWDRTKNYIENPEKEVPLADSVKGFSDWLYSLVFWVFFLAIPISYANSSYVNRYRKSGSWWLYPWKKWWAWPVAPIMLPYLAISQPFVILEIIIEKHREKKRDAHNAAVLDSLRKSEERFKEMNREANSKEIVFAGDDVDCVIRILPEAKNAYDNKNYRSAENWLTEIDERLDNLRTRLDKFDNREKEYKKILLEVNNKKDESRNKFGRIREIEYANKKETLEGEIFSVKEYLSQLGKQIMQRQRELATKTKELKLTEEIITKGNDRDFLKQFDEILAFPLIKGIEVVGNEINIFTDTIFIDYKGQDEFFKGRYEIGSFRIRFNISGYPNPDIRNLTNTSIAKDGHPYGDGSVCFGNIKQYIYDALKAKNFVLATLLVLQSLQTGEGDSPGNLKYWKKVK